MRIAFQGLKIMVNRQLEMIYILYEAVWADERGHSEQACDEI